VLYFCYPGPSFWLGADYHMLWNRGSSRRTEDRFGSRDRVGRIRHDCCGARPIEVQAFQSGGGNAIRQKLGAGCVNSTATLGGPIRSFFTETTRHSRCSPLSGFCTWSLCRGATMSVKSMSAPCALMFACFRRIAAFPSGPVNDHRNVHFYPLAATCTLISAHCCR
jgi:hypothetical protein